MHLFSRSVEDTTSPVARGAGAPWAVELHVPEGVSCAKEQVVPAWRLFLVSPEGCQDVLGALYPTVPFLLIQLSGRAHVLTAGPSALLASHADRPGCEHRAGDAAGCDDAGDGGRSQRLLCPWAM